MELWYRLLLRANNGGTSLRLVPYSTPFAASKEEKRGSQASMHAATYHQVHACPLDPRRQIKRSSWTYHLHFEHIHVNIFVYLPQILISRAKPRKSVTLCSTDTIVCSTKGRTLETWMRHLQQIPRVTTTCRSCACNKTRMGLQHVKIMYASSQISTHKLYILEQWHRPLRLH
jgi:hypothetical protein